MFILKLHDERGFIVLEKKRGDTEQGAHCTEMQGREETVMAKSELNIYTIAKEAGVSPSTVSRVMTQNARVSEEKRRRVEEVIRKYDYRPNALAQGLASPKTKVIGLLSSDLMNPYYAELLTKCEQEINRRGYYPMIFSPMNSYELEVRYLQKMFDMRVDAIIMMGGKSDQLVTDPEFADLINRLAESVPVITTGKVEGARCWQVSIDEMSGVDLAMDHLFSLGHRHIAMIGGRNHVKSTYDKRMRYKSILRSHGITFRERYVPESDYDIEGGYECMNRLFDTNRTIPTAVMAINDFSAVGVMRSVKERGLKIPEDMAIVSFDNTFIVDTVLPRLTSISYDYDRFGRMLVDTAVRLIQAEDVPMVQQIPSKLVVRNSTVKYAPDPSWDSAYGKEQNQI